MTTDNDVIRSTYRNEYREKILTHWDHPFATLERLRRKTVSYAKERPVLFTALATTAAHIVVLALNIMAPGFGALVCAVAASAGTVFGYIKGKELLDAKTEGALDYDIKSGDLVTRYNNAFKKVPAQKITAPLPETGKTAEAFDCAACKARAAAPAPFTNIPASIPNIPGW